MRGLTGWAAILAVPAAFGIFAALAPPGPLIGLLIFVGFFVPILFATAEWFLLEHRIYRHGIVFRSLLPGMKTYVVPYYSCRPQTLETIGRRVNDGPAADAVDRRFRQCPATRVNITLEGLDPSLAMKHGTQDKPWRSAIFLNTLQGELYVTHPKSNTWVFSSRTPEHHVALLRELIEADHAQDPALTAGKPLPGT